jgi:8-oxo-dGTP diphosphatase
MLHSVKELPSDKRIAGVHCIPFLPDGTFVMVWDRDEQMLTTIGGRIEGEESVPEALDREAFEEAGLVLQQERIPFAAWYWEQTDTYTVWFLAKVERFVPAPEGFEKTGHVIFNLETARQLIEKLEGPGLRTELLDLAKRRLEGLGLLDRRI